MTIHHLGTCPLTGERCDITAEYRKLAGWRGQKHVRETIACSLGPCEHPEACKEYGHFPARYEVK